MGPSGAHCLFWGSTPWSMDWAEGMKMELLPRLGLRSICISASCGGIDLTRAHVQSLGMGMGRC